MRKAFALFFMGLTMVGLPTLVLATDLNDITNTLETPVVIITKLMLFACYVVGAILIFASIAQYRNHRESPKLVPLTTPVMLLILGIVLLLVPYFTTLAKDSASAVEQQKREGKGGPKSSGILGDGTAPADDDFGPGSLPPDEPDEPYNPGGGGGGHWSDGYR